MNYYTSTIPLPLAEKLKEKGMPKAEKDCHKPMTKFCEVFDWLETKGVGIGIKHHWSGIVYQGYDWNVCQFHKTITPYFDIAYGTWHEAAEKAIEKALKLI